MNKVYYIYEEEADSCGPGITRVVTTLSQIPGHISRIGVFERTTYLKRQAEWKETT